VAATFIYSDERAKYVYGAHHPLKPIRLQLTYELMQVYDLLTVDRCCTIPAPAASMNELSCFHTVEYLDVLQAASEGQGGLMVPITDWVQVIIPSFLGCFASRPSSREHRFRRHKLWTLVQPAWLLI
jgi:acetoin utilization deacetylase AcuC-like enzyme